LADSKDYAPGGHQGKDEMCPVPEDSAQNNILFAFDELEKDVSNTWGSVPFANQEELDAIFHSEVCSNQAHLSQLHGTGWRTDGLEQMDETERILGPERRHGERCLPRTLNVDTACLSPQTEALPSASSLSNASAFEADSEGLSMRDAVWFLDVLEAENETALAEAELVALRQSGLRNKAKHRAAIFFWEDVNFITRTQHRFRIPAAYANSSPDSKRWVINELSKVMVASFSESIKSRTERGCIWAALLDRVLFLLSRSGFSTASIINNEASNRETVLVIGCHHISRSNITKVLKRYAGEGQT